jgi:hypothetical protein
MYGFIGGGGAGGNNPYYVYNGGPGDDGTPGGYAFINCFDNSGGAIGLKCNGGSGGKGGNYGYHNEYNNGVGGPGGNVDRNDRNPNSNAYISGYSINGKTGATAEYAKSGAGGEVDNDNTTITGYREVILSTGGNSVTAVYNGTPGIGYGAGGSGGAMYSSKNNLGGQSGGAGTSGFIRIYYYV